MLFPKAVIVRSEPYRRYVASQPCFACGIHGHSQAAHANNGKGLGMKTSDSEIFPLCGPHGMHSGCHWQHDNCVDMTRDIRRAIEAAYVERMKRQAVNDGWIFDGERLRKAA